MTNNQLLQELKDLSRTAPRGEWLAATRADLTRRICTDVAIRPSLTVVDRVRMLGWTVEASAEGVGGIFMNRAVASALLAVVFVVGSASSVVAFSTGTVPGDRLYRVKLGVEDLRLAAARSAQNRIRLEVEFAARRLTEASALARRNGGSTLEVASLVGEFESNVARATEQARAASSAEPESGLAIAQIVDARLDEYVHTLETTRASGNPALEQPVNRALKTVSRAETEALQVLIARQPDDSAVAERLDKKIKSAEANLVVAGGAKGATTKAQESLAAARERVSAGDYVAAITLIKEAEDIVFELDILEEEAPAGEVKGDATETPNEEGDSTVEAQGTVEGSAESDVVSPDAPAN